MHGDRGMVELLLSFGADPDARSDEGKTPADAAREQGHTDLAALLRGLAGLRTSNATPSGPRDCG